MTKPPTIKDMWMEDVSNCTSEAHDAVENELKKKGIFLTDAQSDWLWDDLWKVLEELSNGNYRREL